jgi:hypothetical protein
MRSALLTNTSTTAANVAPNPSAAAANSGQIASSQKPDVEKLQSDVVLSKNRGPNRPKKTDGLFEGEELDEQKEGATAESIDEKRYPNTRRLFTVA